MKIKVCGMREALNIEALAELPIDLIGFIFYDKSPRCVVDELSAYLLFERVSQGKVGVFVNADHDTILNRVHQFELEYVQLHGDETPAFCAKFQEEDIQVFFEKIINRTPPKIIKAFRVNETFDFSKTKAYEPYCDYFLFDTKGKEYGGTGHRFDWSILEQYQGKLPFLLSGGIDANAAAEIKAFSHPKLWGIDVNSKFEIVPGRKDVELVKGFVEEMRVG